MIRWPFPKATLLQVLQTHNLWTWNPRPQGRGFLLRMDIELKILKRLVCQSRITTKELDSILLEEWGNEYDAKMHCNSMLRRGLIDYCCDGDWSVEFSTEDVEEWELESDMEEYGES